MENDTKRVRKVARCISTLLENDGVKVTPAKIMDFIKDKDLSNINNLKVEVSNDMRTPSEQEKVNTGPTRKQRIETFMISNWASIKDNDEVKEALLNAYCQGRYNKDQRAVMRSSLLSRCEPNQVQVEEKTEENISQEEMDEEATSALASALMADGNSQKYDF